MRAGRRGPADILLIEDDSGDVLLLKEAFKACRDRHHFSVVENGEEAIAFLRRQGKYADAPTPDLVLLDLNMPRKDGREALQEIKADPKLRRIPVVVMTTSKAEEDIFRSYDSGASSYITKPVTFERLVDLMKTLGHYWIEFVELPS